MKTFDFEEARKFHHKEIVDFLQEHQNKKIGESFYVIAVKKIRQGLIYTPRDNKQRLNQKRLKQPTKLKREYRRLKEKFGFFM